MRQNGAVAEALTPFFFFISHCLFRQVLPTLLGKPFVCEDYFFTSYPWSHR